MVIFFLTLLGLMMLWMTGWYFVAHIIQRTDIVDMVWGLTYGLIALVLFTLYGNSLTIIPLICILFWSVRLFAHIIQRLKHHPEDTRYAHFRTLWGENFRWKSYTYIFLLQGLFIAIIALPFWILFHPEFRLSIAFFIGLFGWILGFVCEFLADRQMNQFRANPHNKGTIIQSGLWKYSRHPNYFGELLMWWSLWIMSISDFSSLLGIVSPLLLSYLIIYVTGIPLLEASLAKRPGFQEYKQKTPLLIPFFGKK